MAITSEIQKKYGNTERNTGAKTYTLFRGEASDAKPTFAQPGDVFEEYDTGKVYVCFRDAKNRTKWTEDATAKRQTESGQTGLPALTGKNGKVLGVTLDAQEHEQIEWVTPSSGGGAEKFVVTLAQDAQTETWTADKTVSEIVAADEAGKNVVAFFQYMGQFPTELPKVSWIHDPEGTGSVFIFSGIIYGESKEAALVAGQQDGGSDAWQVTFTPIPTPTNAPLIVTLEFDDPSEPTAFVGDKTYGEVFTAASAGIPCTLVLSASGASVATPVLSAVSSSGTIMLFTYDTDSSSITSIQGSSSDYVTIAIS